MKLAFQLAYRNLIGSGLRTWLNVGVLSFAFIVIIFYKGFLEGWNVQARVDTTNWEYGYGQLLHKDYDPLDPFTLQDGHGKLKTQDAKDLSPILIQQASIYPDGRMMPIMLKGIDTQQKTLLLPTQLLEKNVDGIPAIIGMRMASSAKLKEGDQVLLRWRDKNGTFDAANITVVGIFDNDVPQTDAGLFWIPIEKLWEMTDLADEATLWIAGKNYVHSENPDWNFKTQKMLLKELDDIIEMKKYSSSIMYGLLLAIALLAIFDTQVLSVFRRQKEIGTYISLGMTRMDVVKLFTVEGSMYSVLATIAGAIYGFPLFLYISTKGIGIPEASRNMGLAIAERIFPVYSLGLVLSTVALVVISSTIVSFLPARKIAKMDPVDALKGKLQ